MVYAVKVTPLRNYNILVEFNTGEIKIYNCYPLFTKSNVSQIIPKLGDRPSAIALFYCITSDVRLI